MQNRLSHTIPNPMEPAGTLPASDVSPESKRAHHERGASSRDDSSDRDSDEAFKAMKARRRLMRVWTWVGAILLAGVAVYLAGILNIAIGIIVWTVVIVFVLAGPVSWMERHGLNRTLATAIAYVGLIAILILLLLIVFSPVFGINSQFNDLMQNLPVYVTAFQEWLTDLYNKLAEALQSETIKDLIDTTTSSFSSWLQSVASTSASVVITTGATIGNIFMCIGFALVVAFWMLKDLPKIHREAKRLISPKRAEDAHMLSVTVTRVMGGYLKATLVQCGLIGLICGLMFWALDVPSPAALGVITGLLNIIPIVGPWLGGGLAFVASVIASPLTGVLALLGTIAVQQIIYTFVSPKLMSNSVDIHPALTFIALMAGSGIGTAMGGLVGALTGALLSIPLTAMAKSVFVYYFEKRTGRRIVSEDGVFFKGVASEDNEVDPMADATAPMPAVQPGMTGRLFSTGQIPVVNDDEDSEPSGY